MTHGSGRCWLVGLFLVASAAGTDAQTAENAAWARVVAAQREGMSLYRQEAQAAGADRVRINRARVQAFRRAAAETDVFTRTFLQDTASVRYLNATFYGGYYSEFAEWDERALILYKACLEHSKLRDAAATFGDPAQPLASYVQLRIEAVLKRLTGGTIPAATAHDQVSFAKYSGKGGINLTGIGAPDPVAPEKSLAIAGRLSFPGGSGRAAAEWRRLLGGAPELQPIAEDRSAAGILVFGIKGTPSRVRRVASLIDSYRKDLTNKYFDSGLRGPTLVVLANLTPQVQVTASRGRQSTPTAEFANAPAAVMNAARRKTNEPVDEPSQAVQQVQQQIAIAPSRAASLDAEDVARILSTTVHYRNMAGMEGYFEPLDNSLVLRKNLTNERGDLFLGTGLHELVHALIQTDYPRAPMWLNEGMAALHEEYGPDAPHDNYRLYVARAAMDSDRWMTVQQLLEPNVAAWGSKARPVMVAAARYFCMFLFREGKLAPVYKAMREAEASGGLTVAKVVEDATGMTMPQLEARWRADLAGRDLAALAGRWGELRAPVQRYVQDLPPLALTDTTLSGAPR